MDLVDEERHLGNKRIWHARLRRALLSGLIALATATGCAVHGSFPAASTLSLPGFLGGQPQAHVSGGVAQAPAAVRVVPPLSGIVRFPAARKVQATMSQVATAATVSLINSGTNTTVITTLTDASGSFAMTFPGTFTPDPTAVYVLEAVKGLYSNIPGRNAARVRTLIQFDAATSTWQSITSGGLYVDESTTALAIGAALRNGQPSPFVFSSLLNSVTVGSPDTYAPVSGLSASDYTTLLNLTGDILVGDGDPVAGVALQLPDTWVPINQGSPAVSSLSPTSGPVGTAVSITGSGFSTLLASDSVGFNGVYTTATSATTTNLTVNVPSGSTSGQVTVQVGNTIALGPNFGVLVVLTSFTPTAGPVGTSLTITGTGFDPRTLANNQVTFTGGVNGTLTAASSTSLTATVPTGAISGPFTVTSDGQSATSTASFDVIPVISSFSPGSGTVGSTVTITGTGFDATNLAHDQVVFTGGVAGTVTAATPTSLTVTVPTGALTGTLAATVNGQSTTSASSFTLIPVVSGFNPGSGSAGTSLTITGTGFDPTSLAHNQVTFAGGVVGTVTAVTATSVTVTVPTGAVSGTFTVTVNGQSTTSASSFVVPVIVSSFTPGGGLMGTSVTISGSGFSSTSANDAVTFNGVAATVTSASPTSLAVTAPSSTTGPIAVTVAGQTGTSATNFTYGMMLDALYPPMANTGQTMTLEGGFGSSATVNFPGGTSVAATVLGPDRLSVTVPAGASRGALSVTTGGTTVGSEPFSRASYGLGLGNFQQNYPQAATARQMPSLDTDQYLATSVVVGNYLYLIGGSAPGSGDSTAVRRALINADGSLGAFTTYSGSTLVTGLEQAESVVIGGYVYVLGGGSGGTAQPAVERAAFDSSGNLGPFAIVSGVNLVTGLYSFRANVIGAYLYVIGGDIGGSQTSAVERAPIDGSGNLGAFTTVAGVSLVEGRYGQASVVAGDYLYELGGYTYSGGGTYLGSVERAPIDGSGNLGPFSVYSSLTEPRYTAAAAVIGGELYIVGGDNGAAVQGSVEAATVDASGNLGAFSIVSGISLETPRDWVNSAIIGNDFYVLGGWNGTDLTSIEIASIDGTGGLSAFNSPGTFAEDTTEGCSAVLGNYLYLIGGYDTFTSTILNTVQRATINPDGSLGPFSIVSGVTLADPTYGIEHQCAEVGGYFYVLGGNASGVVSYNGSTTVERAPIYSDGTLGPFSVSGIPALSNARTTAVTIVADNTLYDIGGFNAPSYLSSLEEAPIGAGGTLGSFFLASASLAKAQYYGVPLILQNTFFMLGGVIGVGDYSEIQQSTLSGGAMGSFSISSNSLATNGGGAQGAILGSRVYVTGSSPSNCCGTQVQSAPIGSGVPGTFTASPNTLMYAAEDAGVAVLGNYVYILGGYQCPGCRENIIQQATLQ